MTLSYSFWQEICWPLALFVGWIAGEFLHARLNIPKISTYAITGFLLGLSGFADKDPSTSDLKLLVANLALGLLLFEAGYRTNLRWIKRNVGILLAMLTEVFITFTSVFWAATIWGQETINALLLATLCVATSPATVIRVMHEMKSSGQLTERIIHHAVFSSIAAVLALKIIVGWIAYDTSENLLNAASSSFFVMIASISIGVAAGKIIPALLRAMHRTQRDSNLAFSIAVIFLVALTHEMKWSPILATMIFGLTARHNRIIFSPSQGGFGVMGELLAMFLFIFVASQLDWSLVVSGLAFGVILIFVRLLSKVAGNTLWARFSGTSIKKGALTGIACAPLSAVAILLLEQTRYQGLDLTEQLAPLTAAAFLLEILGPLLVQRALILADEIPGNRKSNDAT